MLLVWQDQGYQETSSEYELENVSDQISSAQGSSYPLAQLNNQNSSRCKSSLCDTKCLEELQIPLSEKRCSGEPANHNPDSWYKAGLYCSLQLNEG